MLAGENNLLRAAAKIHKMGPHTLVIKRGEYGAILFREDGHFMVPGYLLQEVFDPTDKTVDQLMKLDLPAGVDVEIKAFGKDHK